MTSDRMAFISSPGRGGQRRVWVKPLHHTENLNSKSCAPRVTTTSYFDTESYCTYCIVQTSLQLAIFAGTTGLCYPAHRCLTLSPAYTL